MGFDDGATTGTADATAHHHLLEFLRGLSGLDDALGRWRPDYGGLAAPDAPGPGGAGDVSGAHLLYATGLSYFADHPDLAWALGEPSRDDVAAAIADARLRFGAAVIPLEELIRGSEPDRGGGAMAPAAAAWAAGAVDQVGPVDQFGPVGQAEEAHPGWAEPAAPVASPFAAPPPGPPPESGDAARRPPGSRLVLVAGIAALLVTGLIVALALLAAHYFLGPGPTAGPAAPTLPPTALPSSVATVGPLPSLLATARSCSAIPSGGVPSSLALTSTSSGIGTDPTTGFGTPYISITLAGPMEPGTPALSVITAILPYSATAPSSGPPVDRAGTVQLVAGWDSGHWYGGLRSWSSPAWSSISNPSATPVDVTQSGDVVTVFWGGLTNGDQYGVVLATAGGCTALDLTGGTSPTASYTG